MPFRVRRRASGRLAVTCISASGQKNGLCLPLDAAPVSIDYGLCYNFDIQSL